MTCRRRSKNVVKGNRRAKKVGGQDDEADRDKIVFGPPPAISSATAPDSRPIGDKCIAQRNAGARHRQSPAAGRQIRLCRMMDSCIRRIGRRENSFGGPEAQIPRPCPKLEPLRQRFSSRGNSVGPICQRHLRTKRINQESKVPPGACSESRLAAQLPE